MRLQERFTNAGATSSASRSSAVAQFARKELHQAVALRSVVEKLRSVGMPSGSQGLRTFSRVRILDRSPAILSS